MNIYKDAKESDDGLKVSWPQVKEFADSIYQIIDGTVLGFKRVGDEWVVSIEMFDSYYWKIYTSDDGLFELLKKNLPYDQILNDQSEFPKIPVPHQHKYHYTDSGQQMRGPSERMENWNYAEAAS